MIEASVTMTTIIDATPATANLHIMGCIVKRHKVQYSRP